MKVTPFLIVYQRKNLTVKINGTNDSYGTYGTIFQYFPQRTPSALKVYRGIMKSSNFPVLKNMPTRGAFASSVIENLAGGNGGKRKFERYLCLNESKAKVPIKMAHRNNLVRSLAKIERTEGKGNSVDTGRVGDKRRQVEIEEMVSIVRHKRPRLA